eukprot:jgi/Botrbrau1/22971/Bobra.0030s0043.1
MNLVASPVGQWDICGDRFYSKQELFKMQWKDIKLDQLRVACALYGGPIAVVRDDRKIVLVTGGITKPVIRTFTAAGAPLGSFLWEGGRIISMGLDPRGGSHHPGGERRGAAVQHARAEAGAAVLDGGGGGSGRRTAGGAVGGRPGGTDGSPPPVAVSGLAEARPQRLADPALPEAPADMAVIPPSHTLSGSVEVLLAN